MRPVRLEIKYMIAVKTIRTELEKECMPMLCTVITSCPPP